MTPKRFFAEALLFGSTLIEEMMREGRQVEPMVLFYQPHPLGSGCRPSHNHADNRHHRRPAMTPSRFNECCRRRDGRR